MEKNSWLGGQSPSRPPKPLQTSIPTEPAVWIPGNFRGAEQNPQNLFLGVPTGGQTKKKKIEKNKFSELGELVGTQRKNPEHVMFEKLISKDARAVRRVCTTQEPSRAVRITQFFFEPPILWLRPRRLVRKSTKNHVKIDKKQCQISQKWTKNRSWAVLGAQRCFGGASGRAWDGLWMRK